MTLDLSRARERLRLTPEAIESAAVRAANRTATTVRTEAIPLLRNDYPNMKAGELRARMKLVNARRSSLVAAVTFSGKRIGLYGKFGMRTQGRFGIRFGKLPWRVEDLDGEVVPPEMLARAFRNRLRRGGRATAFVRLGKGRYPIGILTAPGLSRALVEQKLDATLATIGRARFRVAFDQELRFALSKVRG